MSEDKRFPYRHRDINWLSFNDRVLQEAEDLRNPLFERLKFIAIFSSNLDEYFRVRVSQMRQMKRVKKQLRKKLALKPSKFVKEILAKVTDQQERLGNIFFKQLVPELASHDIHLLTLDQLKADQYKNQTKKFFKNNLQDLVDPKVVKASKSSSIFLTNQQLYFLTTFTDETSYGFVEIPVEACGRFIELEGNKEHRYPIAFIDDLLRIFIKDIFTDKTPTGIYAIKLSRDAELYLDHDIDAALADQIYDSLKQRMDGQPTRLLYDKAMPKSVRKNIRKSLKLGKIDMVEGGRYHNFKDFFEFPDPTGNNDLHKKEMRPIAHPALEKSDFFKAIGEKDRLVHFPYMSFDYIQKFLDHAACDDQVKHIKISLYRVATESALTDALLKALKNGKKVTVFVEAKARFDEENNIIWGRKFEEHGARVIYSYPRIKVHSKILLIERLEDGDINRYAYIGTGNFNAQTSKIYCDHGLFTADSKLTGELERVFEVLQGDLIIPRAKKLLISPFTTRREMHRMIRREMDFALEGKPAHIQAKMNQLEDKQLVQLLYRASMAGVKIDLIVRGFSCLIPGLKGKSENIHMISIVDQFLEHGRIYKFHNGGDPVMYMGSADWMGRNLDRRIEVLTPIRDPDTFKELDDILQIQFKDNQKARQHVPDESNPYIERDPGDKKIRSQRAIYEYLRNKHKTSKTEQKSVATNPSE